MDRIVIVTKKTRLEELVLKCMTYSAAKFDLESSGQSITNYDREDLAYKAALSEIAKQIPSEIPFTIIERNELPNFLFRDKDLIIACGPDGLFANLAQYVGDQIVLTVNPDKQSVAGVLMLFNPKDVGRIISLISQNKHKVESLPFVKAAFGNDKVLWGLNDIFIGRRDQVSARYEIKFDGRSEHHSSSGIVVSTGVGSTGWISSIVAQVEGITRTGMNHRLSSLPECTDKELIFVVREPFASPDTSREMIVGRVTPSRPLVVVSEMPEGGFIFSDGIIEKAVLWDMGMTVTISVGERFVKRVIEDED